MLRQHSVLLGIGISLLLLVVAALHYPGGSQADQHSVGYDWKNNYLSNLFSERAVNGSDNSARPWAISGMLFLCASLAWFFIEFSKKISAKSPANIIRYCGAGAMLFAFLAVTPYHDEVITIASTLALVSMFYVTVFVFKSRLHLLKVLSVLCLLSLYVCNYVYYTRSHIEFLPVLQKIAVLITIGWILSLEYFTTQTDFL
ncbi:MAG: hypothetical protein ABSG69_13805 [Candidatus Acidiferrum sp.]|jgi:hypothetical protein